MIYILLINLLGFWSMWEDKKRARKRAYRLSEKMLFGIALVGGSLGSTVGMHKFRHKTKHWYFLWGMPAIAIVQILGVGILFQK